MPHLVPDYSRFPYSTYSAIVKSLQPPEQICMELEQMQENADKRNLAEMALGLALMLHYFNSQ